MKVLVDNAPFKTLGQGGLLPLFKFLVAQEAFGPGRQKSRLLSPSAYKLLPSRSVSKSP